MSADNVTHVADSDAVATPLIGFVVSVEQLALLRDLLSAHPITVVIDDCHQSALLDDQWKPWARRVRTQLKHVSGQIIVHAPSYSFPDPHNHPKIRETITSQLQAICDLAIMLAAHKIIIPIEAGIPPLYSRICHYLEPLASRVHNQQMGLVLAMGIGTTATDLEALQRILTVPTTRCINIAKETTNCELTAVDYVYEQTNWADDHGVPSTVPPTCTLLIGPHEATQPFRQYWEESQTKSRNS